MIFKAIFEKGCFSGFLPGFKKLYKVFNNKLKTLTGYMPFKVLFIINGFT